MLFRRERAHSVRVEGRSPQYARNGSRGKNVPGRWLIGLARVDARLFGDEPRNQKQSSFGVGHARLRSDPCVDGLALHAKNSGKVCLSAVVLHVGFQLGDQPVPKRSRFPWTQGRANRTALRLAGFLNAFADHRPSRAEKCFSDSAGEG